MSAAVTVVIRAKNEAESIGRNLDLVASQTVEAERIVVDSGSTDDTVAIARDRGAKVLEIPAESFTYGYSLNVGCEQASAPLIVALSAHAFPTDDRWLERMVAAFEDERVACACGYEAGPEGEELTGPRVQDTDDVLDHPLWGYSNVAGGFRAELWRQRSFRPDMPGVEDKEWAWYWIQRGYVTIVDPALDVEHDHSDETMAERYRRAHREWVGLGMFVDVPGYSVRELVREWWTQDGGRSSMLRARLSPTRAAELAGDFIGSRAAARIARRAAAGDSERLVPRGPIGVRVPRVSSDQ
jgi:rhamnosyltransferase